MHNFLSNHINCFASTKYLEAAKGHHELEIHILEETIINSDFMFISCGMDSPLIGLK